MSEETPPPPETPESGGGQPKVTRRGFLGTGAALALGLVIGGVVGGTSAYFLGQSSVKLPTGLKQGTGRFLIGTSVSTSGPTAAIISQEVQMFNALVTLVNNRGGVYAADMGGYVPLQMIVYQDNGPPDPATVKANYTKLVNQDNVDLLIGPFTAAPSETASPIAIQNKVPYIDNQAVEIPIYSQPGASDWVVGSLNIINYWLWNYLNLLKTDTDAKTIALIDEGDDFDAEANGTGVSQFGAYQFCTDPRYNLNFDVILKDTNVNNTFSATFDYTAEVQKLKSADPDVVIYCDATAFLAAKFFQAMKNANYKPKAFHTTNGAQIAFINTAGSLAMGYTGDVYWDASFPYEGLWGKNFWQQVQNAGNFTDQNWPWLSIGYSCVEDAVNAVQVAGSTDKSAVMQALKTMEFTNLLGPWRAQNPLKDPFPPPSGLDTGVGMSLSRAVPVQIISGKRNVIGPPDIATAKYQYPEPLPW